jgi:hypothetical protein
MTDNVVAVSYYTYDYVTWYVEVERIIKYKPWGIFSERERIEKEVVYTDDWVKGKTPTSIVDYAEAIQKYINEKDVIPALIEEGRVALESPLSYIKDAYIDKILKHLKS